MKFEGVYPAIASTFTESGDYDYDSYQQLVNTLVEGGCHGLTLFAIAGEYYKLTEAEEHRLMKIVIDACQKSEARSVISITKHATEVAVRWAQEVEAAGADCLMLLPPFFMKPSGAGIREHIVQVCEAVSIPIMLQYAPEQTGVAIAPEVLIGLTQQLENLTILKIENKPPGPYVSKLLEADPDVQIFVGNAGFQMIENFDRGARGVLPGCSMFDVYLKLYNHYLAGERQQALDVHTDLLAILNHIRQNVEMIIAFEKKILKRRGIIASDYCRKPSFTADAYYLRLFDEYYERVSVHFL